MSNFTRTLWFSARHGLVQWSQAVRDLGSPELGRLLDRARRPD